MSRIGKTLVTTLVLIHLAIAACFLLNHLAHATIIDGAEAIHAQFAYQMSKGQPMFNKIADPHLQELWYGPLGFNIMGGAMYVFGNDIRVLRLTTFFFALGAAILVGLITWKLCGDRFMAFVAAGLMIALPVGPWYIEVGPNPYHVFFTLLGIYFLIRDEQLSWSTVLLASCALFAGFWSKQTGYVYMGAGVFYMLVRHVGKGLSALGIMAFLTGAGTLYYTMQANSDFIYLVFVKQFIAHVLVWNSFVTPVLFPENLGRFGIMFATVSAFVFERFRFRDYIRSPTIIFLGATAVVGIFGRLKFGSGPTQALVFDAMLLAIGLSYLHKLIQRGKLGTCLAAALLLVQGGAMVQNLRADYITDEDDVRFEKILSLLATPGKTIYTLNYEFDKVLLGKQPYRGVEGARGCWVGGVCDRSRYPKELLDFFGSDPFDMVIIDIPTEMGSFVLYERLNIAYTPIGEIPASSRDTDNHSLRWRKVIFTKKIPLSSAKAPAAHP